MRYILGVVLLVVGIFFGLRFADFDYAFRWLPVIAHRSALTHGVLVPLLLFCALRKETSPAARLFVVGTCVGMAVHLSFDLFPRWWQGYALIHMPFWGRTAPLFSQVWLLAGIVSCLILACRRISNIGEFYLALGSLVTAYGIAAAAQPRPSFFALLTLLVAAPLALILARPTYKEHDMDYPLKNLVQRGA